MLKTRRFQRTAGAALCAALLVAGCGGTDDEPDPAAATSDDTATEDQGGDGEATEDGEDADQIACGPLDETQQVTVSISSPNMAFAAVELPAELGVYEEMGIDFQVETLGAPDAVAPLGQGEIDAIISVLSAGVLNAMDGGIDIEWGAPLYSVHPDAGEGLWYRPDFVPEGEEINGSLLEGATISSPAGLGGTSSYILAQPIVEAGLTFDDLTYRQMGTPDILAALESGALDVGWLSDPFWQQAEEAGLEYWRGFGDQNGTAILMGPGLTERPEVAVAFFQAISETISQHLEGDDYLDDPETREALANVLEMDSDQLDNPYPHQFDPQLGLPGAEEFATQIQETFIGLGGLLNYEEPIPASEIINRTYAERGAECASQ